MIVVKPSKVIRIERNCLAEAFIRGIELGAEYPYLAGDGDAMYSEFRDWVDREHEPD